MAFNYANLGGSGNPLENMLPIFGSIASGAAMANHPNFINQLAAAITTAAAAATPPTTAAAASQPKRASTPEAPPAPKLSALTPPQKIKPNQGTAPMDLENDGDSEMVTTTTTAAATSNAAPAVDKQLSLNMHDPNLFLNSLMNPAAASAYMYFPTATTATPTTSATSVAAAAAGSMLMDHNAMLAAAMQQMQQGYAMPDAAGGGMDAAQLAAGSDPYGTGAIAGMKEVIKTKSSILFPPNPNAPPPTIRDRPPGCRTIFVGGLPENISEEIIREIFESCGEITTLRMSKKNFCHIRYRHEAAIDRAIYLSGYRVRISNVNEPANFGRLHVDYAQARDDQYDFECRQRQLQREQRHRERMSLDRLRSQSPPPMPHYTDHEAGMVAEQLRQNDTFIKAIQTIAVWLERGDCTKRNANCFYSMIQSTHAHVRRLNTDKQQLEEDLRKARECYRKQMLTMSSQFTQIEKVFSAASHKKVWDHFTKAQRKNIDQWKKLATELRSVQIEDDEMEMSDDDYQSSSAKRARYDSDGLKEENDSLRCQLEAIRNEMSLERTDIKYNSDFREKQIKVLQETIRNMQTQLLATKVREQKDNKTLEQLERRLKEAGVKQLLLKTKIKETVAKLKDKDKEAASSSVNSETSECLLDVEHTETAKDGNNDDVDDNDDDDVEEIKDTACIDTKRKMTKLLGNDVVQIIDIDMDKSDDDVRIIEDDDRMSLPKEKRQNKSELHAKTDAKETTSPSVVIKLKDKELQTPKIKKDTSPQQAETEEQTDANTKDTKSKQQLAEKSVRHEEFKLLALSEAKIIALTAAFLVIHPLGSASEQICAYLNQLLGSSTPLQAPILDDTLKKYSNLFAPQNLSKPNVIKTDAKLAAAAAVQWKFCGFLAASAADGGENSNGNTN